MTNNIEIDLRLPFEENLERALALAAASSRDRHGEIVGVVRRLYELAHGRSVQTALGLVPVAPPIAPGLSRRTIIFSQS